MAVDAAPPFTIAAIRFGVASVLLYAWAKLTNRPLSRVERSACEAFGLVGALFAVPIAARFAEAL